MSSFPSELLNLTLRWDGPRWLQLLPDEWPKQAALLPNNHSQEVGEVCLLTTVIPCQPVVSLDRFSSLNRLLRITVWVRQFVCKCRAQNKKVTRIVDPLPVPELNQAKPYWMVLSQRSHLANSELRWPWRSCLTPVADTRHSSGCHSSLQWPSRLTPVPVTSPSCHVSL